MAKKKSNWQILRNQKDLETNKNRDVFEDQDLERGTLDKPKSMWPRTLLAIVCGVLAFIVTYLLIGVYNSFTQMANNGNHQRTEESVKTKDNNKQVVMIAKSDDGYYVVDGNFNRLTKAYSSPSKIPLKKNWYVDGQYADEVKQPKSPYESKTTKSKKVIKEKRERQVTNFFKPSVDRLFWSFLVGLLVFGMLYEWGRRNLKIQNIMYDNTDINQYKGDQHVMLVEELMSKFEPFPDAGAHSYVQPASLISHTALKNKGVKTVLMTKRYAKDTYDGQTHELIAYKGAPMLDSDGNRIMEEKPILDHDFMERLFDASDDPKNKLIRKYYDPTKINYVPEGVDDKGYWKKLGVKTVADLINKDWEIPAYETQRPAGAYWVDTNPVNTMVLAITRGGKGQTYIEPLIDMWTREKRYNNIVINDPKGELLKKFYVPATYRGFQIVQFNLINAMNTDIYNPLIMAAEAAREGDFTRTAAYVGNIADVFFPTDSGEDPVWPNAANNAFKRAAYVLIDIYLEEEKELRRKAIAENMDAKLLETKLDQMWGKVTLYNCYQLFVQLTSKKIPNPMNEYNQKVKDKSINDEIKQIVNKRGYYEEDDEETYTQQFNEVGEELMNTAIAKGKLWNGEPEIDELSLLFNATDKLPLSQMRNLVQNANNALKSMAGAEKMLSSVYGIAITAMSFFTDPTISTLTSGAPSQNVDLAGISFPRRVGFRFASKYAEKHHIVGQQAVWQAYSDSEFKHSLGDEFSHEMVIDRTRWAKMYFKGIFPEETAYLKCTIRNASTKMETDVYYFKFVKSYQTSLSGRTYVRNPIMDSKIVKNGVLYQLMPDKNGKFVKQTRTFKNKKMVNLTGAMNVDTVSDPVITQYMVRYSEQPKMIFLVTPPHLMSYAKIILILVKQLTDLNFEQSYMTKSNQKPLYKTRFMLDELGNLQSNGHGINGFQTMLSIGLGQEQQFTLILQTLQQLKDVYGDSVDKIVQGNTANIVFLKSTDDSMIETLEKMSGKRHVARRDNKTVTTDLGKMAMRNEGKLSYSIGTKEEPVITYNDLAFISPRNSIVFSAGYSPMWNRNQTILPMSWMLLENNIIEPGQKYTFQTIPTLSTAKDFDVRKNQPDFEKILEKRINQALVADDVKQAYKEAYDYSDHDIAMIDPDDYSDEIMTMITVQEHGYNSLKDDPDSGNYDEEAQDEYNDQLADEYTDSTEKLSKMKDDTQKMLGTAVENTEVKDAIGQSEVKHEQLSSKIYAQGMLSKNDLIQGSTINHQFDIAFSELYRMNLADFKNDKDHFIINQNGDLLSSDGSASYITVSVNKQDAETLNKAAKDSDSQVYSEEENPNVPKTYVIQDSFIKYLVSLDNWSDLLHGKFDSEMHRILNK